MGGVGCDGRISVPAKGSSVGVGYTGWTPAAYAACLRMLAEGIRMNRIVREIHARFPAEHGSESARPVTFGMVRHVKYSRRAEVAALRQKLLGKVDDLWIASKRHRLEVLQTIIEDANRWVPTRLLEAAGAPTKVVYTKNFDPMIKALRQAREELGEDPASRNAESLEALVRRMEDERGLEKTVNADYVVADAVPMIEDALLVELEPCYPSAGADAERGFLDGRVGLSDGEPDQISDGFAIERLAVTPEQDLAPDDDDSDDEGPEN